MISNECVRTVSEYRRAGLSLVEVVISIIIVAVMLTAALNTVGAARVGLAQVSRQAVGDLLAQELLAEILQQSYQDPDEPFVFGVEATESANNRSSFDDIDDYNGWSASPPQDRNGNVLTDFAGWRREVAVDYVDPANLLRAISADRGIKRITVTVSFNGKTVRRLITIRTRAYPEVGSGG